MNFCHSYSKKIKQNNQNTFNSLLRVVNTQSEIDLCHKGFR